MRPRCFDLALPPFVLEGGAALPRLSLSGWWWGRSEDLGPLQRRARCFDPPAAPEVRADPPPPPSQGAGLDPGVPTVLLVHALTGDSRAGGDGGWWGPIIGPGRALDPQRARLLCFNNLGGCYGSFGAAHPDWPWRPAPSVGEARRRPGLCLPAPVSTYDQARAILRALDALGIGEVQAAIGGSLGGMIVLALGALDPKRFRQLVPVAATAAASPWVIGLNHVARQAILLDPEWPTAPRGLSVARQIAQMTYRAEPGLEQRQGRRVFDDGPWDPGRPYAQQTYLEHQGDKLVARFHAPSYLVQLDAMDHHDLRRPPPPPTSDDRYPGWTAWTGPGRLDSAVDAIGIDTDRLFSPGSLEAVATEAGGRYHELSSLHGHDAFLIEWTQLDRLLRRIGAPFEGFS